MPKSYHGQIIPLTFEVRATRPLRDTEVIDTAADRLLPDTWLSDDGNYYVYPGMITVCKDTGVIYTYVGRENNPDDIRNPLLWVTGDISNSGASAVYIGPEPPDDPNAIWVDTSGEALPNQAGAIPGIRGDISTLQTQVAQLMNLVKYGVLGGDSTISANSLISQTATPINPNTGLPDPDPTAQSPDGGAGAPTPSPTFTIPHLVLKTDTRANFLTNRTNLIENEIVLVTDAYTDTNGRTQPSLCGWMNGKLVRFGSSTASGAPTPGENENPTPDMTQQEIEALFFTKLGMVSTDQKNYTVNVNADGNLILFPADNYDNDISAATALLGKLVITEAFFGGEGTAIDSCAAATHNFVEIANLTTADINLNGLYLCYYNPRTVKWFTCPLQGVARANTTFLVRGAQCAVPSNDNLHVSDYDIQWLTPDGAPIQFSRQGGSIYLTYSQLNESGNRCLYDPSRAAWLPVADFAPTSIYNKDVQQPGYIDLFGVKILQNVFSENDPIQLAAGENILDCVFFRFNGQDVTTSTIVAYASRKTTSIWCYCNFARQTTAANPYFTETIKQRLTPAPSRAGKTFFGTRSVFSPTRANYLNCTFGRHATSGTGYGADRCFTWVSCGYHDEYLQYRKVSTSTTTPDGGAVAPSPSGPDWQTVQSITPTNVATVYNNDPTISTYIKIYARKRWVTSDSTAVTTHRVILRGLSEGTYEYRVHRPSDPTYASDTLMFVVKADSTAATFNVVQTSDQQGFTFMEYQAWAQSAHAISQQLLPDFTINTGDLTQSGNRESEWLDYYNGRHPLRNIVEMPTVGNNDLGPVNTYDFRTQSKNKVSAKYFQYLYTFDLDPDNSAYFRYVCDSEINDALVGDVISYSGREFVYYMPSMYSFDFGAYHFICLNSEFYTLADDTNMGVYSLYYNDKTIAPTLKTSAYYQQYKWLVEDVRKAKAAGKKLVVFCHEIPFNITAFDGKNNAERSQKPASYSELNTDFTSGIPYAGDTASAAYTGGYAYSEFFQLNDIHLCLGGHKHTYSLSYPIKERVSGSGATRTVDSNNPIVDKTNYTTRTDGVVYLMSQATGYKLSSNNDKPCTESPWLYKWFPYNITTDKVSTGQQYPMFNVLSVAASAITINSYYIDGVWYHPNASTATAFNINNQHPATTHPIDGVTNYKVFY